MNLLLLHLETFNRVFHRISVYFLRCALLNMETPLWIQQHKLQPGDLDHQLKETETSVKPAKISSRTTTT
jgi:hypothetical protein